jgi:hypothetical protein
MIGLQMDSSAPGKAAAEMATQAVSGANAEKVTFFQLYNNPFLYHDLPDRRALFGHQAVDESGPGAGALAL